MCGLRRVKLSTRVLPVSIICIDPAQPALKVWGRQERLGLGKGLSERSKVWSERYPGLSLCLWWCRGHREDPPFPRRSSVPGCTSHQAASQPCPSAPGAPLTPNTACTHLPREERTGDVYKPLLLSSMSIHVRNGICGGGIKPVYSRVQMMGGRHLSSSVTFCLLPREGGRHNRAGT